MSSALAEWHKLGTFSLTQGALHPEAFVGAAKEANCNYSK